MPPPPATTASGGGVCGSDGLPLPEGMELPPGSGPGPVPGRGGLRMRLLKRGPNRGGPAETVNFR